MTNQRVKPSSEIFDPFGPNKSFLATLSIEAPALDGYVFQVLQVAYELALYPVEVQDLVNNTSHTCAEEKSFEDALKATLSSDAVRRAVGMLLAQSKSEQVAV